jgi:DNA-directed RNA polymerase beta subunit
MERDCMLGQGAAKFARDRLFEQSDETSIYVCKICGMHAHADADGQNRECKICETKDVARIRLPYGTKLISQELMAMNIVPRIIVKDAAGGGV